MAAPEHRRYDSDEFDYSGCEACDVNGDTLGWPCPTVRNRNEQQRQDEFDVERMAEYRSQG